MMVLKYNAGQTHQKIKKILIINFKINKKMKIKNLEPIY